VRAGRWWGSTGAASSSWRSSPAPPRCPTIRPGVRSTGRWAAAATSGSGTRRTWSGPGTGRASTATCRGSGWRRPARTCRWRRRGRPPRSAAPRCDCWCGALPRRAVTSSLRFGRAGAAWYERRRDGGAVPVGRHTAALRHRSLLRQSRARVRGDVRRRAGAVPRLGARLGDRGRQPGGGRWHPAPQPRRAGRPPVRAAARRQLHAPGGQQCPTGPARHVRARRGGAAVPVVHGADHVRVGLRRVADRHSRDRARRCQRRDLRLPRPAADPWPGRAELVERGRGAADRAALLVAAGRDAPRAGERLVGGAPAGLRRRRAGRDPVPATPAAAARPPLPGRHAARSHPPRLDHCRDGLRASGRRAPAPVPFGAPSSRLWRAAVSPHGRTAPHGASRAYRQRSRASEVVRVHRVDVGIVGAGPTGLFAAYYAGFRGLSSALIDALPEAGGQVSAMYPEKQIFDVAGFPAIRGRDLVANLVQQAAPFRPTYLLGRAATELSYEDGRPVLGLDN